MKIFTRIIVLLLSILGFSSCTGKQLEMYGQPSANFIIMGTVVDKATKAPVEGILIKVNGSELLPYNQYLYQTPQTGYFYADMRVFPSDMTLRVIWQDIDRGIYKKDSAEIKVLRSEFKGGDGRWYEGSQKRELTFEIEKEVQ